MLKNYALSCLALSLLATPVLADVVETIDGARLVGTITSVDEGILVLETSYAGEIEIEMAQVLAFETDDPRFVKLDSGSIIQGQAVDSEDETRIELQSEEGDLTIDAGEVEALWPLTGEDPDDVRAREALEAQQRKWSYRAGVNIAGQNGNTEELLIGITASATLEGPKDRLRFYTSLERNESDSELTAEEYIGGVDFTSYFADPWGWYVRSELERDEFEDIDLRSTTAGGLSYRFFKEETHRLEGRAGVSYRYESYLTDVEAEGFAGLDFGLIHYILINDFAEVATEITYVPSVESFGDFRLVQDTNVTMPIGDGGTWNVQLGLKNDYNAEPLAGNEELDTSYYARLLLIWD